jgi:hypothetical protein
MSRYRTFVKNKQSHSSGGSTHKRLKRAIVVIILLIIVGVGIKLFIDNKEFDDYKTVKSLKIKNTYNETRYLLMGSDFLRYSNDGVSYISGSKVIWNQAFELKNPLIDSCGDYVAICGQKTNEIYLFNTKGLVGKLTASYPITDIEVSSQGVVYTLLEDGNVNYIEAMDKDGNKLIGGETVLDGEKYGYPVDCSVSEDGEKLVISYLHLNSGAAQAKVAFYNFSDVGKNEVDRLVGGFNYSSAIIPKIEFLNNNLVCGIGDNMLSIYSMKEKPKLSFESKELFKDEIKSVFYNSQYIGFVLYNNDTNMPYVMHIYNTNGKEVLVKEFDTNYTDIKFANNDILIYNSSSCEIFNIKGTKKFEHTFDNGIVDMIGAPGHNRYLLADPDSVSEIKLK